MPTPGEIAADRCPTDVQEYGQRNGLPEFARATWQAGFIDGYRFAAQRGAEADQARLRLFEADRRRDGYIIPEAPPQTGGGIVTVPGAVLRLAGAALAFRLADNDEARNSAIAAMDQFLAECETALVPPQTGGGDAADEISIDYSAKSRLANSAAEGLDGALLIKTGGGDAGERAQAVVNRWLGNTDHADLGYKELRKLIATALRSSHREGAEAMREALATKLGERTERARQHQHFVAAGELNEAEAECRAMPIPQ